MHSQMNDFFAFILAGGSGERFWPMSRAQKPKHLLRLLSDHTLLEETVLRILQVTVPEQVFVLTNAAQLEACQQVVPQLPKENFIAEPAKRDTGPAAALATAWARSHHAHALCGLFPADAMIHDCVTFGNQVQAGIEWIRNASALLTFSIPPRYPATGFGYLELGEKKSSTHSPKVSSYPCYQVRRFVEKPDLDTAKQYFTTGGFGWNSGIFLWQAEAFLAECQRLQPQLATWIEGFPRVSADHLSGKVLDSLAHSSRIEMETYLRNTFPKLPKISVDYAILEQAQEVVALPALFDWDDVGTWTALPEHCEQDLEGNTRRGETVVWESQRNIVIANSRSIALCGVQDLVIVETPDAVLVCHRDAVQDIKNLQAQLREDLK